MRRDYQDAALDEADLKATWLEQFTVWFDEAVVSEVMEPDAMVFATADERGHPSARTVLLKGIDARGLVLFTNLRSRKGREATANPWASLVFPWHHVQRQVIVLGRIEPVSAADADAYFASRPYGARVGALISPQSEAIADRSVLDAFTAQAQARYPPGASIPRPAHWGGLRVLPDSVEFWQGRPDRLHDRLRYRRDDGGRWLVERLAP